MAAAEFLRIFAALTAVIGMIGIAALLARKFGLAQAGGGFNRRRRLSLVETLPLDARRRLAIIKCDDAEHLIVLGAAGETLLQSHLDGPTEHQGDGPAKENPFPSFAQLVARRATQRDAA